MTLRMMTRLATLLLSAPLSAVAVAEESYVQDQNIVFLEAGESSRAAKVSLADLRSLDPAEVLAQLDLSRPGLEAAAKAQQASDRAGALRALLAYYRRKYALRNAPAAVNRNGYLVADQVVQHVFQWGPYEPADYGPSVNWEWDPRGDIEWVAAIYRFSWALPLAEAYQATRDDKYARAFVELAGDWIAKHPLQERHRAHPVYTGWRGFPWLDIQTGNRATAICRVFPILVHGESFTPEFLGVLLASLYDHQAKTERLPMGQVHNKAIFEQRGFVNVAAMFPEFREAQRWMQLALERTRESFLAQTTPDGVQREWSFGYNCGVLRDAVDVMRAVEKAGLRVPDDYRDRVRRMYDYLFAIATRSRPPRPSFRSSFPTAAPSRRPFPPSCPRR